MTSLFPRLSPSLQRSLVAVARVCAGLPIDRAHAYDRGGDVLKLRDEAERLADALLAGCGDHDGTL